MSEVWGAILRGLGTALGTIYDVIPSYGVAIIILTIGVRVLLIPLTIRQIRSMTAMQKLQPQLKELQKKYKVDRLKMDPETVRERRAKQQEETMKLYREHGVNPLGGCFPLLMQAPVFIALYSVLRAAVPAAAIPVEAATVKPPPKAAVCTPAGDPSVDGRAPTAIVCEGEGGTQQTYQIGSWQADKDAEPETPPAYLSICRPGFSAPGEGAKKELRFACASPIGTGHLPKDSDLFADIVEDRARFLGLELACSPTQAGSDQQIRTCTSGKREAGGAPLAGYYMLVLLMAGTTYYQQLQVQKRSGAEPTAQMKMMGRIMPLFLGFVSLNIPAGVIIYWVASNVWTIGQQTIFFRKGPGALAPKPAGGRGGFLSGGFLKGLRSLGGSREEAVPEPPPKPHRPSPPSRSKKRKKRRR